MEHDKLTTRLRAARPAAATIDPDAFDAALLERLRQQPAPPRGARRPRRALTAAGGVVAIATVIAVFGGSPSGPTPAAAVTQALHWLNPPAGTILHTLSISTQGGHTTTLEMWQAANDPTTERLRYGGDPTYETAGAAVYDPSTNTIYLGTADAPSSPLAKAQLGAGRVDAKVGTLLPGDPIVEKVRTLLQDGDMTVGSEETHDGTLAFPISLNADAGRPIWTLWVSATDGRPLELIDPGRDSAEAPQDVRWPTYQILPGTHAGALLTLAGAHPSAHVVSNRAQIVVADQRLMGKQQSNNPAADARGPALGTIAVIRTPTGARRAISEVRVAPC